MPTSNCAYVWHEHHSIYINWPSSLCCSSGTDTHLVQCGLDSITSPFPAKPNYLHSCHIRQQQCHVPFLSIWTLCAIQCRYNTLYSSRLSVINDSWPLTNNSNEGATTKDYTNVPHSFYTVTTSFLSSML